MKTIKFLLLLLLICFAAACTKDFPPNDSSQFPDDGYNAMRCNPLQLKIAVISDIHYMAPSLLKNGAANGEAFQTYLNFDPKLIEYSDPIFRKVISLIKKENPDIVLIPGDLTKDGEKVSHEAVASLLRLLENNGTKVFVIPGNHDVNNPEAVAYNGDNANPVPTIQARDFARIYGDFGYKNALCRDPNSLTYISQPYRGLWILGIDDCEYYNNTTTETVAGIIKPETMTWILAKLSEAKQKNIMVLGMMHHGIMEHYAGQNQVDPGYVTENWETNSASLMNAGLKIMFTGHYHANDITMSSTNGNVLYDIETGSLVTPLSPYRIINLTGKGMDIHTKWITSINCTMPGGVSFTDYSHAFLSAHLDGYFYYVFTNVYRLDDATATFLAPYFRDGWMAHYAGDELMPAGLMNVISTLPSPLDGALYSIWTDLPPADNQLYIDLK
jgi:predicted MPP superfamily phosphohydrolase